MVLRTVLRTDVAFTAIIDLPAKRDTQVDALNACLLSTDS